MWEGRKHESVRIPLAGALLNYLQLCRGPGILQLPPSPLQALLQGVHPWVPGFELRTLRPFCLGPHSWTQLGHRVHSQHMV